jgi:uncharacterized protein (TIRG00374 family)
VTATAERPRDDASDGSPVDAFVERLPWRVSRTRHRLWVAFSTACAVAVIVIAVVRATDIWWALQKFRRIVGYRLAIAIAFEMVSIAMIAVVQRRLFREAGATVSRTRAAGLAYAQVAIALSAPGGPLLANTYVFREFRKRGLDEVVIAWILGTIAAVSTVALTVVTVVGARDVTGVGTMSIVVTILAVLIIVFLFVGAVSPARLNIVVVPVLIAVRWIFRRPADPYGAWTRFATRLGTMHLGVRDWFTLFTASVVNWAADCICFILCARALHAEVPITGVVLAYAAGQGILAAPITPGAFGLFEAVVPAALVAAGVHARNALAIVLLYRFIAFWGVLLIGWTCWLLLRRFPVRPRPVTS